MSNLHPNIITLPDILLEIFGKLDAVHLGRCEMVSRVWRDLIAANPYLWRNIARPLCPEGNVSFMKDQTARFKNLCRVSSVWSSLDGAVVVLDETHTDRQPISVVDDLSGFSMHGPCRLLATMFDKPKLAEGVSTQLVEVSSNWRIPPNGIRAYVADDRTVWVDLRDQDEQSMERYLSVLAVRFREDGSQETNWLSHSVVNDRDDLVRFESCGRSPWAVIPQHGGLLAFVDPRSSTPYTEPKFSLAVETPVCVSTVINNYDLLVINVSNCAMTFYRLPEVDANPEVLAVGAVKVWETGPTDLMLEYCFLKSNAIVQIVVDPSNCLTEIIFLSVIDGCRFASDLPYDVPGTDWVCQATDCHYILIRLSQTDRSIGTCEFYRLSDQEMSESFQVDIPALYGQSIDVDVDQARLIFSGANGDVVFIDPKGSPDGYTVVASSEPPAPSKEEGDLFAFRLGFEETLASGRKRMKIAFIKLPSMRPL